MKYLVTGAKGQVGSALCALLKEECIGVDLAEMDLGKPEMVRAALESYAPDIILNPAAWTAVDKAEAEEEAALKVNGESVREIARYAFAHDIPLVHYSTDYVFPGDGTKAWKESDRPGPKNAYGRTKLAGEAVIASEAEDHPNAKWLILRTSWVYAERGHNFVNTMLKLGAEREVLSVVDDQIGAPTYAADLATVTLEMLRKGLAMKEFPSGIYHAVNGGETSWFEFAEEIFRQVSAKGGELSVKEVKPVPSSAYPTPAVRPLNSRMDCGKLERVFGITFPAWQDALARCLGAGQGCGHHHRGKEACA